jgi:hypothetical protein
MSTDRSAVADGGLASISANFPLLYQYAAVYVDKILKGANPASLPVEQPSKFQVTEPRRKVWLKLGSDECGVLFSSRHSLAEGLADQILIRCKRWSEWQDLNLRPPRAERCILPHRVPLLVP